MPTVYTYTGSIEEPEEILVDTLGIGIKYPFNENDGIMDSTYTTLDTIRANLNFLLDTEPGERIMIPDFGVPLRKYLFDAITPDLKKLITVNISNGVRRWIPEVELKKIDIEQLENKITVNMIFNLITNYEENIELKTHRSI